MDSSCLRFLASSSPSPSPSDTTSVERINDGKSTSVAPIFLKNNRRPALNSLATSSKPSHTPKHLLNEDIVVGQSAHKRARRSVASAAPLAERIRPTKLSEFVGQDHLTGSDSLLMKALSAEAAGSVIFWGPPGCGKTTLARLVAKEVGATLKELSATTAGVQDIRVVFEEARKALALSGRRTLLFLDEIHRFTKSQQDVFLPFIEQGHVQLIGATTENPSFKLTGALLSRCRIFLLDRLTDDEIMKVMLNAVKRIMNSESHQQTLSDLTSDQGTSLPTDNPLSSVATKLPEFSFPQLTPKILQGITAFAGGDARVAISLLDVAMKSRADCDEASLFHSIRTCAATSYNSTGDDRYDMISALHKSIRGSHGSAAMYWLARMLSAGEDPVYIARRLVVCASEDIGLADKHALPLAIATLQACQAVGMPECRINLAHIVAYLSEAPKSTRSYEAYRRAEVAAKSDMTAPVPLQMRNAPTKLMNQLGYGEGYNYNPEFAHPVTNTYLPPRFATEKFLRDEGDISDKAWDEKTLKQWEIEINGGEKWEGRTTNQLNKLTAL